MSICSLPEWGRTIAPSSFGGTIKINDNKNLNYTDTIILKNVTE